MKTLINVSEKNVASIMAPMIVMQKTVMPITFHSVASPGGMCDASCAYLGALGVGQDLILAELTGEKFSEDVAIS